MSQIERFVAVEGFQDRTDYLEYDHDTETMTLVLKNGDRKPSDYCTLEKCRRYVREGAWRVMEVQESTK
jgi:hypothetical protein